MKAKPKANGKSKVTFDARKPAKMAWEAFSFEKWTHADLHPPLVTIESKIAEFVETARREAAWSAESKADGKPEEALRLAEMANENRAKAAKWRKLSSLPKAEGERLDWQCYKDLAEGVDFLIARSVQSDSARIYLSLLIDHALRGLNALAAHEKGAAATLLIDRLVIGVKNFELLAWHNPKLFTHYTRRLALIPATISPQSGNAEECQELMDRLDVGKKSIYAVTGKGKRWRETSPANALALRLVAYIESKRGLLKSFATHLNLFESYPAWFPNLANAADFGADTWKQWAEIAWQVIVSISPDGKPGKLPAFYDRATKICNVRKTRRDPYFGTITGAPSIAEGDIKEAFFGAFELIATGESRRKKQRRNASPTIEQKTGK
jgi:hypothetical protein